MIISNYDNSFLDKGNMVWKRQNYETERIINEIRTSNIWKNNKKI
jgi:hypothetical protein